MHAFLSALPLFFAPLALDVPGSTAPASAGPATPDDVATSLDADSDAALELPDTAALVAVGVAPLYGSLDALRIDSAPRARRAPSPEPRALPPLVVDDASSITGSAPARAAPADLPPFLQVTAPVPLLASASPAARAPAQHPALAPSAPAPPAPAPAEASTLDADDVAAVVRHNQRSIAECLDQLERSGGTDALPRGKQTLLVTVAPDGSVSNASLADAAAARTDAGRCIARAVASWRFPSLLGAVTDAAIPLILATP